MQTKLHRWAGEDPSRCFGDLFNLVYDPAFLVHAFERVASNAGAKTAGADGVTVAQIKAREGGELGFLARMRDSLKSGEYRPAEVRQVMIPKGKNREIPETRNSDGGGIVPARPVIFLVSLSSLIRSIRCAGSGWRSCSPSAAGGRCLSARVVSERADHAAGVVDRPGRAAAGGRLSAEGLAALDTLVRAMRVVDCDG